MDVNLYFIGEDSLRELKTVAVALANLVQEVVRRPVSVRVLAVPGVPLPSGVSPEPEIEIVTCEPLPVAEVRELARGISELGIPVPADGSGERPWIRLRFTLDVLSSRN